MAVLLPGGRPIPLKVTANDESGKTFQIPVPADQYKLVVLSKRFVLSDSSGAALEEKDDGKGRVLPPQVAATISAGAKNSVISLSILRNRQ